MPAQLKIVVVEDHDDLRDILVAHIESMGHQAIGADCAEALNDLLDHGVFDLAVLDLNLPGEDGISIAKRLKSAYPDIFILMLTVRDKESERIIGYEAGADIYLPKSTSLSELKAAITALARRHGAIDISKKSQDLILDIERLELIGNAAVKLGRSELIILKSLIEAPGRRMDYWRLLELLGKEIDEKAKSALEVAVVRLRKKLKDAGIDGYTIRSLHKEGYQLIFPPDDSKTD